jgi:hypothetical protein
MIAHLILFRPRADVSPSERRAIIDAYAVALREIAVIRRARVGRRVLIGRAYEDIMRTDFPYAAILEFDDLDGLRTYLDHAAHQEMATRLFAAVAETLVYDFEMEEGVEGLRGMSIDERH